MTPAKGYTEMKDSGIKWISEIPAHWGILRGKNVLRLLERPVKPDDDVITCFRDGEVTLRKNRREEGFTNSLKEIGYQGVEPGDLIVHGMDGFAGSIGISDSRGKASPVLNVMDSNQNKRYLMYYLRAMAYKDVFMALSTGIRVRSCDLRWNKLSVFPFLIPTSHEQSAIAAYLDTQCAKIDEIIARAKASIEDYKQWKASVVDECISQALTSSPQVRLKFLMTYIVDCPHETPEYCLDGDYLVIRTADQDYGFLRPDDSMYPLNEAEFHKRSRRLPLEKNDIVYGREGERWGLACLVPESGKYCLGQRIMQFRCKVDRILPHYAMWALNSRHVYLQGIVDTLGSTSPHVNISTIRNYYIPIPPIPEQRRISTYLFERCGAIDAIIKSKQSLIDDLESYKKSLIYEVVTGKRRVC